MSLDPKNAVVKAKFVKNSKTYPGLPSDVNTSVRGSPLKLLQAVALLV